MSGKRLSPLSAVLLLGLSCSPGAPASVPELESHHPLRCKDSRSPLFQADANDILKLEIISDFRHINRETYSETGGDSGILSYLDRSGKFVHLPVFIRDRGHSRRDFCEWVPLRIIFEGPRIRQHLEKRVPPGEDRPLRMYRELKKLRGGVPLDRGVPQKDNLFRKLGDDIKLVTHCGKSSWKRIGGETREQQEARLLQEYYIYQVLDQLGSVTLKTRLAEITYRDPEGDILLTRKAFFREPRSRLAKRCGLAKKPWPGAAEQGIDDTSWFQLELFNRFVYFRDYGQDGRNVNLLYHKDGRIFTGPYDFDLSGIIVPDYRPNSASLEENLRIYFSSWIAYHEGDERALVQIFHMVQRRAAMRRVLENSLLAPGEKAHMLNWFDSYMEVLERFVETSRRLMPELLEELERNRESPDGFTAPRPDASRY